MRRYRRYHYYLMEHKEDVFGNKDHEVPRDIAVFHIGGFGNRGEGMLRNAQRKMSLKDQKKYIVNGLNGSIKIVLVERY